MIRLLCFLFLDAAGLMKWTDMRPGMRHKALQAQPLLRLSKNGSDHSFPFALQLRAGLLL